MKNTDITRKENSIFYVELDDENPCSSCQLRAMLMNILENE
jgi:hypothetical protein